MMSTDNSTVISNLTNPSRSPTKRQTSSSSSSNYSFLMKLLPYRRRQSEEVKRTSSVLDDYANLLSRDSNFLASVHVAAGDAATVSSASASLGESVHTSRPSVVTVATVGSFQRREVSLGALLGKGQFSKVYEIVSIELDEENDVHNMTTDGEEVGFDAAENARSAMSKNARAGKYAMKRLRKNLLRRPREFTRAAANLVLEAQYLSKLDHPNILKLRGSALGGASSFQTGEHDGYFLILDRVTETLSERIHRTWANARRVNEPELLYQKTHYALQLASALHYLHDRRIIFRDLCPRNIGFTEEHLLQLFDFGLARELPPALGLANELFHMTQNAGSKPYTAVEVATKGLYNLKADVYSWSIVAYELFMEELPFAHLAGPDAANKSSKKKLFANKEFLQAVYIDGERPSFEENEETTGVVPAPPQGIQDLLARCWQGDLFHRPTMEEVYSELANLLEGLPHTPRNLEVLGSIPPKMETMVLETQDTNPMSISDLTNGVRIGVSVEC